jgi:hypothetical protein
MLDNPGRSGRRALTNVPELHRYVYLEAKSIKFM